MTPHLYLVILQAFSYFFLVEIICL